MSQRPASQIAFVATGDEIIQGDIVDSNCPWMAEQLTSRGYLVGEHRVICDDEVAIADAISQLAKTHRFIITTGGLGPTSDDLTRQAVASAAGQHLRFDEEAWDVIQAYFDARQVTAHECNRQQAYFPANAVVLANPVGTAPGCRVDIGESTLFMLPGPPHECQQVFLQSVLPFIENSKLPKLFKQHRWRVFGIGESTIAPQIDSLVSHLPIETSFRAHAPYLDIKCRCEIDYDCHALLAMIDALLAPYVICAADQTASSALIQQLKQKKQPICIIDPVTKGGLARRLVTPETHRFCQFIDILPSDCDDNTLYISIEGFTAYWLQADDTIDDTIEMVSHYQGQTQTQRHVISFRYRHLMAYVIERLSYEINQLYDAMV